MDWTPVLIGLGGGVIGVAGGVSATVLSNRNARRMALDAARREAYVGLVNAVYDGLIPAAKYVETGEGPGDLEPIIRARSYVIFGSTRMVLLYADLLAKCAAWGKAQNDGSRGAAAFAEVSTAALAVEHRIYVEMQPPISRWQRVRRVWSEKS